MTEHSGIKVGINGFGRIGRLVTRICVEKGITVAAINDPFLDLEYMMYQFRYDSAQSSYTGKVSSDHGKLNIDGQLIAVSKEKWADKVAWAGNGVEYVVEASGLFTSKDRAQLHLSGGCKKVLITAPSDDVPMFVFGVNHKNYEPAMNIISTASDTANCLATLVSVVHGQWGLGGGLVSTIHAYTPTLKIVDGPNTRNWRDGRAAGTNIIPAPSTAAAAVSTIIPGLGGKLAGTGFRVPVASVSVLDLTCSLSQPVTMDAIKATIRAAAEGPMRDTLQYTDEQVVSSDFIHCPASCVFDADACVQLSDKFVKLIAWYDNEWGYCHRVVDMLVHMYKTDHK